MKDKVKLILGTMTFGQQVGKDEAQEMINLFLESGYSEIDTAYVYNDGKSEKILGKALEKIPSSTYKISTKVNPRITGKLDRNSINMQVSESLNRLRRDAIDVLYLHFPNKETPIEETLSACYDLYEKGKFKELGLSNFPAWKVVDIWHICKANGYPLPKVYQGVYNGLSRKIEDEMLPALKEKDIQIYAYNPLAGGLLTGKYKEFTGKPLNGRFTFRPNYLDRYWKESFFGALGILEDQCKKENIALVEAAYRWLMFHSKLNPQNEDGILIGASNLNQLKQNLKIINDGVLSKSIVQAFDNAWKETKTDSPEYFRFATK